MQKPITQSPPGARILVERDVPVPMRDGTVLRADVWRADDDRPRPVLLQRTPYDKSDSWVTHFHSALEPLRAVENGFAIVIQDVRGRFASDGDFVPFVHEAQDGYDTVAWICRQPFSNGTVGAYGVSYLGATQLLAASALAPGLAAVAPHETAADYFDGWTYQGGAFQLGFAVMWGLALADTDLARREGRGEDVRELRARIAELLGDPDEAFRVVPLTSLEPLVEALPAYRDWLERPYADAYWRSISIRDRYAAVARPALHVGGWHDIFLSGTLENFLGFREARPDAIQRLVVGPWAHGLPLETVGAVDYGPGAAQPALDLTDLQLRFFRSALGDGDRSEEDSEPVRVFLMGANVWRGHDRWPPAGSRPERLYLHGGPGRADGVLSASPPEPDSAPTAFVYDPTDPVPTCGGATFLPGLFVGWNAGQRDQREVEARADVLLFTSEPLERPLELTGAVSVELHAASSAPDTDWTAKLAAVDPRGRSLNIVDGIVRARHRAGLESPSPIEPDRPYRYAIELGSTSVLIPAGHRLRLQISSSNFPRFDRNPNTGGDTANTPLADFRAARQTIFHDAARPSAVLIPVTS